MVAMETGTAPRPNPVWPTPQAMMRRNHAFSHSAVNHCRFKYNMRKQLSSIAVYMLSL